MFQYLGVAVILCGFQQSTSHLSFLYDSRFREPRSIQSNQGQSPLFNFFNPFNTYPSLSAQFQQAQRDLLSGNRRRYRYHGANRNKPVVKEPAVIPDPVHDHHNEPHVDPVPVITHPEPVPEPHTSEVHPVPVVPPTEPLDTDLECIQGCEVNIAPEKCHCAAHLCDTMSCTGGNACRLVTVGGLVEGTCLPIDSTTGVVAGQNVHTHQVLGCGLTLDEGIPCGRGRVQRFYFDVTTQSCLPFQYLGCGGNDNNHESLTTCEATCSSQHISPGIIDHHNSPASPIPPASHGHAHPDHIVPVGTHGHEHPIDHHEPVPVPEPHTSEVHPVSVVHPTEPLDTDPECIQGCEVNIAPEKCHCAAHLCDTMSCTAGNACRLVTVGGLVEGTCLPIDSTTGVVAGQNVHTHQVLGCGLNLDEGIPCGRGQTQRFYFDVTTQSCLPFQYLGCGGNDNNHESLTTCETTCSSQHISPGIIDHHNSPASPIPPASHGHAHPDHIVPVETHGHGHHDHIVPVGTHGHEHTGNKHVGPEPGHQGHEIPNRLGPKVNHDINLPVSHNDPSECHLLCKKVLVPEYCHCSEHLCDRLTCTGNTVCRLMREMGRVEAMCVPIDPTTGKSVADHHHKPGILNACGQPKDRGDCRSYGIKKFYFDIERQACRPFRYSGCGGNANRFRTKAACEEICTQTRSSPGIIDHHNTPSLDPALVLAQPTYHRPTQLINHARGIDQHHTVRRILSPLLNGRIAIVRRVPETGRVDQHTGHNSHSNIRSVGGRTTFTLNGMDLRRLMGHMVGSTSRPFSFGLTALNRPGHGYRRRPLACGQPKDRGNCRPSGTRRFYFDTQRQACRRFRYSGCGGNANRFRTKAACEEICMETHAQPETGRVDQHTDHSSHSNLRSIGGRTRLTLNGMDLRRLMRHMVGSTSRPFSFGLTALNRPGHGYRRRPLGTSRVAKNSKV